MLKKFVYTILVLTICNSTIAMESDDKQNQKNNSFEPDSLVNLCKQTVRNLGDSHDYIYQTTHEERTKQAERKLEHLGRILLAIVTGKVTEGLLPKGIDTVPDEVACHLINSLSQNAFDQYIPILMRGLFQEISPSVKCEIIKRINPARTMVHCSGSETLLQLALVGDNRAMIPFLSRFEPEVRETILNQTDPADLSLYSAQLKALLSTQLISYEAKLTLIERVPALNTLENIETVAQQGSLNPSTAKLLCKSIAYPRNMLRYLRDENLLKNICVYNNESLLLNALLNAHNNETIPTMKILPAKARAASKEELIVAQELFKNMPSYSVDSDSEKKLMFDNNGQLVRSSEGPFSFEIAHYQNKNEHLFKFNDQIYTSVIVIESDLVKLVLFPVNKTQQDIEIRKIIEIEIHCSTQSISCCLDVPTHTLFIKFHDNEHAEIKVVNLAKCILQEYALQELLENRLAILFDCMLIACTQLLQHIPHEDIPGFDITILGFSNQQEFRDTCQELIPHLRALIGYDNPLSQVKKLIELLPTHSKILKIKMLLEQFDALCTMIKSNPSKIDELYERVKSTLIASAPDHLAQNPSFFEKDLSRFDLDNPEIKLTYEVTIFPPYYLVYQLEQLMKSSDLSSEQIQLCTELKQFCENIINIFLPAVLQKIETVTQQHREPRFENRQQFDNDDYSPDIHSFNRQQ